VSRGSEVTVAQSLSISYHHLINEVFPALRQRLLQHPLHTLPPNPLKTHRQEQRPFLLSRISDYCLDRSTLMEMENEQNT
jgi:hypothetical protein